MEVIAAGKKKGRPFGEQANEKQIEDRRKQVMKVRELRHKGLTSEKACAEAGIPISSYFLWGRRFDAEGQFIPGPVRPPKYNQPKKRRKAPAPQLVTVEIPEENEQQRTDIVTQLRMPDEEGALGPPLVVLIGKEASITKALDSLAHMWSRLNG